jgi:F-type H+-transporting ATPase subunit a
MMQGPDIGSMIFRHTADSHFIEVPFLGEVPLPTGWRLFGADISPTKHVVFLFLAALLVWLTVWTAGKSVERRQSAGKGPAGFGAAIEGLALWVRDDIAIANIGHNGKKFAPYVMTLFFFVLYCNLLGLIPYGSTATGNIVVTGTLAILTFLITEISGFFALGPKGYLKTIVFVPPGMHGFGAVAMALLMTPIELISKLVKPFALCLRLFANMTAGHFVILALLGLIFIFATTGPLILGFVTVGSIGFTFGMMLLELLVAGLQAYIFALLTSVFIGMLQHEH